MTETRLFVDIHLGFKWQTGDEPVDAGVAEGNRLLMRTLNALEGSLLDADEDRLHERLESKLDLALHWLGQVMYGRNPRPEPRSLHLDLDGVAWEEDSSLAVGHRVHLTLFPSRSLAAPLLLSAEIIEVDGFRVRAKLLDQTEAWRDEWTRWLFRRHRQMIKAVKDSL